MLGMEPGSGSAVSESNPERCTNSKHGELRADSDSVQSTECCSEFSNAGRNHQERRRQHSYCKWPRPEFKRSDKQPRIERKSKMAQSPDGRTSSDASCFECLSPSGSSGS